MRTGTKPKKYYYDNNFAIMPDATFIVADYGAVADGKTLTAEAIQLTIDTISEPVDCKFLNPTPTFREQCL